MAADLHCHTKLSDGSVGIEDLIVIAQKSGIDTLAITDHDCLAGVVRGQVIGKRYGINIVPGVEISAFDEIAGKKVHIISYLADAPDRLERICKKTSVARKRAGQIMMLKVAARFPVTSEFIISHASGSTNLYKQHIMHALMDAGYTDKILGKFGNQDEIEDYIELGLDGVEVWSPENSDELTEELIALCKKKKLLQTGGSDFHGTYGRQSVTVGAYSTPQEHLDKLLSYKSRKKSAARRAEKKAAAEKAALEAVQK